MWPQNCDAELCHLIYRGEVLWWKTILLISTQVQYILCEAWKWANRDSNVQLVLLMYLIASHSLNDSINIQGWKRRAPYTIFSVSAPTALLSPAVIPHKLQCNINNPINKFTNRSKKVKKGMPREKESGSWRNGHAWATYDSLPELLLLEFELHAHSPLPSSQGTPTSHREWGRSAEHWVNT